MIKKYEFTGDVKEIDGVKLRRIRAVRDFGMVKAGELGGWLEKEDNLSHEGSAWVYGSARVYGSANVCDNATVYGDSRVGGEAEVYGSAKVRGDAEVSDYAIVCGDAEVCGDAIVESSSDYAVFKNFWSSNRWITYTRSNKMWKAGCFYGTGEELVKKAYKDSEYKGRCYEALVRMVEAIERESTSNNR